MYCFEVLRYGIRCGGGAVVIYVDYFLAPIVKDGFFHFPGIVFLFDEVM